MIKSVYQTEGSLIGTDENNRYISSLEGLEEAMREGRILEAAAIGCSGKLELCVELGDHVGTIERDEAVLNLGGEETKDIAVITRVGKPVCFKVISIEKKKVGDVKIKLSRRLAQLECAANYLAGLKAGDVIPAKITHLEHFGAFADIGCGIISLLSIDCISVSRISHPKDRLRQGSELAVVIKSIEKDESGLPTRIYLSRRELLGSWEENASRFSAGQTVAGIVRSIESYGIFVELAPNLAGLAEYRPDVAVGQTAAVYIKSIIPERMKLKLVIVDSYKGIPPRHLRSDFEDGDYIPDHISHWKYSPECCKRVVETVFDADTRPNY